MVALDETDVLDLGADLNDERGTLDLQILDDRDTVAVLKDVTHGVANGQRAGLAIVALARRKRLAAPVPAAAAAPA